MSDLWCRRVSDTADAVDDCGGARDSVDRNFVVVKVRWVGEDAVTI
jgi:hypothetical protein